MKKIVLLFSLITTLTYSQTSGTEWITEFELSDSLSTADYNSSINYFQNLADASQFAELREIGVSPQGRTMYCLIVDKERNFDPSKNKKLVVLIQNGIHSGEIEGKDASMLLLREILVDRTKEYLIDNAVLLVIPVFNVDGHELKSKYNRINQNGPEEMGWRTTAQNLNLNRDYTKADTPEMRAFLKLFSRWLPDVFIDSHTTDGLDFQYTLTYGIEKYQNARRVIGDWARNEFNDFFEETLRERGVLTSPYFSYLSEDYFSTDPREGVTDWVSPPRFSHGYAAYQNRIGILLETHMLKPYKERVVATKKALEVILEYVNKNSGKINDLITKADEEAIDELYLNHKSLPLAFESTNKYEEYLFRGYEPVKRYSDLTGSELMTYSKEPFEEPIKYYCWKKVVDSVSVPEGYLIPQEWEEVVRILKLHGIQLEQLTKEKSFVVEQYKYTDFSFAKSSYEGRQSVSGEYEVLTDTVTTHAGDYFVTTNQRTVPLIVHLLEPKAPDSFLGWGFFNSIFERTEYFEMYSMEPIARQMIESDPKLKVEFEKKLESDEEFRNDPRARLNFFYERSPYYDDQYKIYPILRVVNEL